MTAPGRILELLALFLKLGVTGFGGPAAHIGMIEDEVVARRGWMDRAHFMDALAGTNLVPGPNSTELAIHVGYLRAGVSGAVIAGVAFILPAFVLMLGLSWAYFEYGAEPGVEDLFYGLKPVVLAVIAAAAYRLGRSAVTDIPLLALFAAGFGLTLAWPEYEPVYLVVAGVLGVAFYSRAGSSTARSLALPVVLLGVLTATTKWDDTLSDIGGLFLRTGGLLFGGGYVMIPLIENDVVEGFGWLTREQFLDGVALGQATPGPIVITATFVGYGAAGWTGAVIATLAIFLPSFLFAILVARSMERLRAWKPARDFLKGVGAAVAGAILATAFVLADDATVDVLTGFIVAGALAALLFTRAQAMYLLVAGAAIGLATKGL